MFKCFELATITRGHNNERAQSITRITDTKRFLLMEYREDNAVTFSEKITYNTIVT